MQIWMQSSDPHLVIQTSSLLLQASQVTSIVYILMMEQEVIDTNCGLMKYICMSHAERLSLIGFHSFTGFDFISSFSNKVKLSCWKTKNKQLKYQETFQLLGTDWELSDELLDTLQEYVCSLFNSNAKEVNHARAELFHKKKAIDLSALPLAIQF